MDALNRILIKELEVLELGRRSSRRCSPRWAEPARVLPSRADEGDPEELGEGDEQARRSRSCGRDRRRRSRRPSEGAMRGARRLSKMPVAAAEYTVSRTYLDWLVALPGRSGPMSDRPSEPRRCSTPITGPREGEGPDPRVPRRAASSTGREGPQSSASLGPRRWQDLARQVHCHLPRSEVRTVSLAACGTSEIRGHRRTYIGACGPGHPRASGAPVQEPGVHPRQDRQTGNPTSAATGVGAPRGARPRRTEQHVP